MVNKSLVCYPCYYRFQQNYYCHQLQYIYISGNDRKHISHALITQILSWPRNNDKNMKMRTGQYEQTIDQSPVKLRLEKRFLKLFSPDTSELRQPNTPLPILAYSSRLFTMNLPYKRENGTAMKKQLNSIYSFQAQ